MVRPNPPPASHFAEPAELLFLPGTCAGSCTCTGSCTCAPLHTPLVPCCAPLHTPLVPCCAPLQTPLVPCCTPLHASGRSHSGRSRSGLSLSIRYRQCGSGCCDGEGSNFSEKGKSHSAGDRFRFDDFIHGQNSTGPGECLCGCNSKVPVLIYIKEPAASSRSVWSRPPPDD